MIKFWLQHPLTRGMDIDDRRVTGLRKRIIREKVFLRRIYQEWYAALAAIVPDGPGGVLEVGSGAGFLDEVIPGLITSEIFLCDGVQSVLDGHCLPFPNGVLRAIVMTDVFHHLPRPAVFLEEAARCVCPGGVLAMNEPWVTPWSSLVYGRLHHEPFQPHAAEWNFPSAGPLSGANSALPWIVFKRDRDQFERRFPEWQIETIHLHMPFRYLLSGGVSLRSLMPGWSFGLWREVETMLKPWMGQLAMFAMIGLKRR